MRPARLILPAMLAACLAATTASAATQLGPLVGFSFSNLRIEDRNDLSGRSTFAAGLVADYGINDRFGIRIEPTYLSKGTKTSSYNTLWAGTQGVTFKFDYVDLPILARYDLATTPTRGYLIGGPSISFATKREAELTLASASETVDMSDVIKSYDVSLDVGAGVNFPVGTGRLTIDGRAAIGVVNINDGGTFTFQGNTLPLPANSTHTLDFRLFATYLFPLGGK